MTKEKEKDIIPAVHKVYAVGFFKKRHSLLWRAPIVCRALSETFNLIPNVSNVIDMGCAIGEYVAEFNKHGFSAVGVEGSYHAKPFFQDPNNITIHDLRFSLKENIKAGAFSLAFSLEVAEHIEKEYADAYLDNLCWASDTILITAAPPGQKGHGHVNCQFKEWWTDKMKDRHYSRRFSLETKFIELLKKQSDRREVMVYANNVMIFKAIRFSGRDF